ncbi:phage tail tube protein [Streptomyces sp. NPDC004721]
MGTTQQRFMRRGVTKFFFLKTIAAADNVPTRSELAAANATDLSGAIADIAGWSLANSPVDTPDLGSTLTTSIPGEDKADASTLTFYEDKASETIESLLSKGVEGFVVILRKGDVPQSKSMDVFPVRVAGRAPAYSTGSDPAKFTVTYAISDQPTLDAAIPAAAD